MTSASITPELLRDASIAGESDGYDRDSLRSLLAAAADALELAWREKHDLTASLSAEDSDISSRAVLLLSSAQRIADEAVSEAESYSKDLVETARSQYREIIERAQQSAHAIEKGSGAPRTAAQQAGAAGWTGDEGPVPAFATDALAEAGPASPDDVVRARQFTRMAAAQAHSLLESIERELGRLGATTGRDNQQHSADAGQGTAPSGDAAW